MNWEALGAIGELVGAIILVLTVAYLALQVRYAKQATLDQNILARAKSAQEMILATAQNEELRLSTIDDYRFRDHYEKLAAEREISLEAASRADWTNGYWFWVHWGQWASTHDSKALAELEHLVESFYSLEGMRRSWETSPWGKSILDPEFVQFVDKVLKNADQKGT